MGNVFSRRSNDGCLLPSDVNQRFCCSLSVSFFYMVASTQFNCVVCLRGGIHKRTQLDNPLKKVIQPPVFLLSSVPVVVQHKWDRHLMQSNTITLYKIIISFLGAVYDSRTAWPRIRPGSPRIWTGFDQGFGPVCRRIKKSHLLSSVI